MFQPGFRLSVIDGIVIVIGTIGSVVMWSTVWWIGFVIAFVIAHFFLFCNVFRVARPLELMWSGIFLVLVFCTIMFEQPSWPISIGLCLLSTVAVVAAEMKKPSYHGIFWQRVNPNLPQWWVAHDKTKS